MFILSTYEKELLALVIVVLNRADLVGSDASSIFERVHYNHFDFNFFCLDNHCGLFLISFPHPTWLEELKSSYSTDAEVQAILQTLHTNPSVVGKFS